MSEVIPTPRLRASQSPDSTPYSSTPATDATCRTCTRCRRKKIKCDNKHPRCGSCQSRGIDCVYTQDARRTIVRAKKADLRELQRKIEALQGKQVELTDNSAGVALSQPEVPQGYTQYHVTPASSSHTRAQARLDTAHSPETMLAEDGSQVYGATSLLHDQSSDTPLANQKNGDVGTRFLPPEIVQDQLISNAAICSYIDRIMSTRWGFPIWATAAFMRALRLRLSE